MTRCRATYQTGFAPRDFAPEHPELWRGIDGAWCPSLGPTGATLRDWGPQQKHGVIYNNTTDAIWQPRQGWSAYFLNTSNSAWDFGDVGTYRTQGSISFWFYPTDYNRALIAWGSTTTYPSAGFFSFNCRLSNSAYGAPSAGNAYVDLRIIKDTTINTGFVCTTTLIDLLKWYHVVLSSNGTTYKFWVNGVQQAITEQTGGYNGRWVGSLAPSGTVHTSIGNVFYNNAWQTNPCTAYHDDLRLFDHQIDADLVKLLYSGGQGRGIAYLPRRRFAIPPTLAAYLMTAEAGALTLTGNDASLVLDTPLLAEAGALLLTGNDAEFRRGLRLNAETGGMTLTGNDAGLSAPREIAADFGLIVLTGNDAELKVGYRIDAEAGAIALAGSNAGGTIGDGITAETGALSLTGNSAGLTATRRLTAETGALTLTGLPAQAPPRHRVLLAQKGTLSLAGSPVTSARTLKANAGALSLSGKAVAFSVDSAGTVRSPFRSRIFQSHLTSA